MKFIFSVLTILFISGINVWANSEDTLFVNLGFFDVESQKINVKIVPKFSDYDKAATLFFKNIKGSEKLKFDNVNIKCSSKISREASKSWWIKNFNDFEELSFNLDVSDSFSEFSQSYSLVKLDIDKFYFLQLLTVVPQVYTDRNYVVALKLDYNEHLVCPMANEEKEIFYQNQFLAENESIIIGDFQKQQIKVNSGQVVDLLYYTDYELIKLGYLCDILSPLMNELNNFLNPIEAQSNELFLCIFKNANNINHSFWGGLATKNYSLITLPAIRSKQNFKKHFVKTIVHEYLHSLTPFSLSTNKTFRSVNKNENYSKHLWLYEGVTEYLTWQFLLQNNYISELKFYDEFGKKLVEGNKYKASLSSISEHIHINKNSEKSSIFYNRGAFLAFMLDILINEKTEGEKDLLNVLKEMSLQNKVFDDMSFFSSFEKFAHPTIGTYLRKVVDENQLSKPNEILNKIGLKYADVSEEYVYTYGRFQIQQRYKKPYYIIKNAYPNVLGLKNGDAIKSINGVELNLRNGNELLKLVKHPISAEIISISFLRDGGELLNTSASAKRVLFPFYNVIRPKEKANSKSIILRNKVLKQP